MYMSNRIKGKSMNERVWISGIKGLASYLDLPVGTVWGYVDQGIIPKRKLGRKLMFRRSEVDASISDPVNAK
jgi:hypothetical protein